MGSRVRTIFSMSTSFQLLEGLGRVLPGAGHILSPSHLLPHIPFPGWGKGELQAVGGLHMTLVDLICPKIWFTGLG